MSEPSFLTDLSELSFLIDLLLNYKLSKEVKILVAERIKVIESKPQQVVRPPLMTQAPSTLMNMNKDLAAAVVPPAPIASGVGGQVTYPGGSKGPRKF